MTYYLASSKAMRATEPERYRRLVRLSRELLPAETVVTAQHFWDLAEEYGDDISPEAFQWTLQDTTDGLLFLRDNRGLITEPMLGEIEAMRAVKKPVYWLGEHRGLVPISDIVFSPVQAPTEQVSTRQFYLVRYRKRVEVAP